MRVSLKLNFSETNTFTEKKKPPAGQLWNLFSNLMRSYVENVNQNQSVTKAENIAPVEFWKRQLRLFFTQNIFIFVFYFETLQSFSFEHLLLKLQRFNGFPVAFSWFHILLLSK